MKKKISLKKLNELLRGYRQGNQQFPYPVFVAVDGSLWFKFHQLEYKNQYIPGGVWLESDPADGTMEEYLEFLEIGELQFFDEEHKS